jgi:inositol transporter-like SP family MFS transporter
MSAASSSGSGFLSQVDDARLSGAHWRWTILSALGDYLDAGSIVAGGASILLWSQLFHLNTSLVGLIGAIGSNGFSTAIGALIGGRLGDLYGRKYIYSLDLLIYALGAVVVILSSSVVPLIIGLVVMGLAVGADIPTSWSLIAEFSPKRDRGKMMGFTNIFWYIGPIVILLLSLAFAHMGLTGVRLVFGSLLLVAIVTWFLRRSLAESPRWAMDHGKEQEIQSAVQQLGIREADAPAAAGRKTSPWSAMFKNGGWRRLGFITPIYVLWGIPAGTYGFFLPYIFKTEGATTAAGGDLLEILWFASAIVAVLAIFMPFNDRVDRRILYAISAAFCAAAFFLLVAFPITDPTVAILNVLLFGFGQGIGLWPLQRVWSVELFPTEVRNTAQGSLWGVMRLVLGGWSLFLPVLTKSGFTVVAVLMGLMFTYNLVVGGLFGPRTQGQSLEAIQADTVQA